jgi:RNA polymerase sigma-70 factor, ECF subfamily
MRSNDVDLEQLVALAGAAREAASSPGAERVAAELRALSVLTVDVLEDRIQTVRIVRNPDKLGHL